MADRTVKVTLIAGVQGYLSGMDQAARKTREVGSEAEALARKGQSLQTVGAVALTIGAAMTAVGVAVAKTGIEYNTLQQTSRAALTTLLGSARAVNEQMDKLDAFARTSPFAKQVFIQAQQQMLAFGIETKKVIPYLNAVQNAVAAAGGSNADIAGLVATMSKVQSSAKLTAQDLFEFGNRGVDAAGLIGYAMGKTGAEIRSEITAGTLDATEALDALVQGMESRFSGAAANVKNTFEGAMDRVRAAWRDVSADLMKPLVDPNGGGALVGLLNWTADMLRAFEALPDPVKNTVAILGTAVAAGALLGGTFLLALPKIAAFRTALQTLSLAGRSAAVGIGAATAALAIATFAITAFFQAQAESEARTESFKDSLDEVTGAVTKYTRELIAKRLEERGAIQAATTLGIAASDLAESFMGNADAAERVSAALAENDRLMDDWYVSGKLTQSQAHAIGGAMGTLKGATTELNDELDAAREQWRRESDAKSESTRESERNEQALAELRGEAVDANGAIEKLADTIRNFAAATLDARAANRQFQSAVAAAVEATAEYGATLDLSTEAGLANEKALDDIAKAALELSAARLEESGSTQQATAAILAGRDALIEQLAQFGIVGKAAQDYADNLGLIPENIYTLFSLLGIGEAEAALGAFFYNWNGRTIRMALEPGGGYQYNADGALYSNGVRAFAQGGFVSGIYPYTPGGIHKFAEAGDEAYISFQPQYRQRNLAILDQVEQRLGVWRPAMPYGQYAQSQSMTDARSFKFEANGVDPNTVAELVYQRMMSEMR